MIFLNLSNANLPRRAYADEGNCYEYMIPPHFLQGEGSKTQKFTMEPMRFFLQTQTPTCVKENQGNCYKYMWRGASLMGRSYFWQDPPLFFRGQKNENLTMAPMVTFCFVTLTLRNPPMEIGEIIGIYVDVNSNSIGNIAYSYNYFGNTYTFVEVGYHINPSTVLFILSEQINTVDTTLPSANIYAHTNGRYLYCIDTTTRQQEKLKLQSTPK